MNKAGKSKCQNEILGEIISYIFYSIISHMMYPHLLWCSRISNKIQSLDLIYEKFKVLKRSKLGKAGLYS